MQSTNKPIPFTPNYPNYVESDASRMAAQPRPRAPTPTSIAGRLGQVLAWTANIIAVAVLVIGTVFIAAAWDGISRESAAPVLLSDPLRINVLQAGLTALLLIIVTSIWGIGRAMRYVLTGPAPRTQWRIWHRPAGEGVPEDWVLQQRDGHTGPWITAATYPTKQAAKAALRSIAS